MVEYDSKLLDRTFAALADPTRRRILAQLARKGEECVTELAKPHDMSLAAVSKHLIVLEKAGLVAPGTRVEIAHDFTPVIPGFAWFVDRFFTRPIAGRTLATFRALAEAVADDVEAVAATGAPAIDRASEDASGEITIPDAKRGAAGTTEGAPPSRRRWLLFALLPLVGVGVALALALALDASSEDEPSGPAEPYASVRSAIR